MTDRITNLNRWVLERHSDRDSIDNQIEQITHTDDSRPPCIAEFFFQDVVNIGNIEKKIARDAKVGAHVRWQCSDFLFCSVSQSCIE
jgi:hypothetical protein